MTYKQQNSPLVRALFMLVIYLVIYYFGGAARQLLYPVIWLVAFLHETGHALGALITGGEVLSLQINPDGSGLTTTRGGSIAIILLGGYVGSAILGNLLFYIGIKRHRWSQTALLVLAGLMVFSFLKWPSTASSGILLLLYAAALVFIALKTTWDQNVVMFFGMASVLYVIQDFQVGPSSDLRMYEEHIGIFPAQIWMYLWLALVLFITWSNLSRLRLLR
jgi:Peptidase M50B-like